MDGKDQIQNLETRLAVLESFMNDEKQSLTDLEKRVALLETAERENETDKQHALRILKQNLNCVKGMKQ